MPAAVLDGLRALLHSHDFMLSMLARTIPRKKSVQLKFENSALGVKDRC